MLRIHRLSAFCAILFTALLVAGCGNWQSSLPFPTPGKQDLVVLLEKGPLTHLDDSGNPNNGLEHDLLQLFGEELGVPVRFITSPRSTFAQQIRQGATTSPPAGCRPIAIPVASAAPPCFPPTTS